MKNGKSCPKCGCEDIRVVSGEAERISQANVIPAGALTRIYVSRYLCMACGYSEEWIDRDDLKKCKTFPRAK